MNVPLFPAPPTRDVSTLTRRDVLDVLTSRETLPREFVSRRRHALIERTKPVSTNFTRKKRCYFRKNLVHPRQVSKESGKKNLRRRVTEFHLTMTERRSKEDDEDDADVICATGVQTIHGLPYMLRVLPKVKDIVDEENSADPKKSSILCRHLRFLGRLSLSQFGLAWLLTFWVVAGAAAFYTTEGPREREQVLKLKNIQRDLAVGLATELRQLKAKEEEMEPLWSNKVKQYVNKHEKVLLLAVNAGYGEGGQSGQLWNFSGCVLFAIALITTLGFGAPVPRTTAGRTVAVIFAAIGIPAHFLLVLNLGLLLAIRLQRYAIRRKNKEKDVEIMDTLSIPRWVKAVPFCCIALYYLMGIICFGAARMRPVAASLLFPLDFTAAGGLATTSGHVRILYALYLEGAVTIAAVAVAILKVSATQSLTNIGLKYGLLTHA
ncbi:TWiK family of potassium channels protein 7-like isoform X3 [Leptopilina boulardi]|uniref:TWiK family of potassium channels protein 7-like isoform X3 n=1 Tax=Leptopilina boulardi TaxID=63433 RepID=UPI0021F529D5|nr:TWiK family of potassium channels protein 7-like isoform X3 [Leptopilina boulardi]